MDKKDIRSILSAYRSGESHADDVRFEEARKEAEADPELSQWWREEKELDLVIARKLQEVPVAAGLKERLLRPPEAVVRSPWGRRITLLAAAIVLLGVLFSSWRGPFQPAASLADFRDEMVGFIKVAPTLELKTKQVADIRAFLDKAGAPARFALPAKLENLEPVGCRTLRFHGNDVTLVCFKREDGKLLHLFVVNRAALPQVTRDRDPDYATQGEWMTAAWSQGDQVFLMTVQGDRASVEKFLSTS